MHRGRHSALDHALQASPLKHLGLPTDHAARAEHGLQLSLEHDRKAVVIAGVETILHSFTNQGDGVYPSGLVQGTDGNFYGTAGGGMNGNGTIFKLTPTGVVTALYSFPAFPGANTPGALVQGSDGNLCGTAYQGGGGANQAGCFCRFVLN